MKAWTKAQLVSLIAAYPSQKERRMMLPKIGIGSHGLHVAVVRLAFAASGFGTDLVPGNIYDPLFADAVAQFQKKAELPPTGCLDEATEIAFERLYGVDIGACRLFRGNTLCIDPEAKKALAWDGSHGTASIPMPTRVAH